MSPCLVVSVLPLSFLLLSFLLLVSNLRGMSDRDRVCDRVVGRKGFLGGDVLVEWAGFRREPDPLVGRQL